MHGVQVYDKKQQQGRDKNDNEKFRFYGKPDGKGKFVFLLN